MIQNKCVKCGGVIRKNYIPSPTDKPSARVVCDDCIKSKNSEVLNMDDRIERPPLGLRPKFIVDELRLNEIDEAIARYYEARYPIPLEWIEERNQLINSLGDRCK
jgi:hypothetical protein